MPPSKALNQLTSSRHFSKAKRPNGVLGRISKLARLKAGSDWIFASVSMVEVQHAPIVELLAPQGRRVVLQNAEELHLSGYDGKVAVRESRMNGRSSIIHLCHYTKLATAVVAVLPDLHDINSILNCN